MCLKPHQKKGKSNKNSSSKGINQASRLCLSLIIDALEAGVPGHALLATLQWPQTALSLRSLPFCCCCGHACCACSWRWSCGETTMCGLGGPWMSVACSWLPPRRRIQRRNAWRGRARNRRRCVNPGHVAVDAPRRQWCRPWQRRQGVAQWSAYATGWIARLAASALA